MSRLILLGNPGTKRTTWLEKGAKEAGVEICLADWKDFPRSLERLVSGEKKLCVKIDPPQWDSCSLEELNGLVKEYERKLIWLQDFGKKAELCFLNEPEGIKALLDKQKCKRRLKTAGIPVTEEVELLAEEESADGREYPLLHRLLEVMEKRRIFQVFVKPNYGSGAAGTMAFRYAPGRGQMALYTCAIEEADTGRLVNTKRLRRFTDRDRIMSMVEKTLRLDCIVERWYAKAEYGRFSYDLRTVVQDGRIDFMLARLSSGPITNLQLNNHPLEVEALGLPSEVLESVAEMCRRAAACYPGLRSMGIDILLERGSLQPRIIEMNGQGDLIYQDIYHENRIYRRQCEMMKAWEVR